MFKTETVEDFLARGGKVTKLKTYGIKKYSSCPSFYLPKKKEKASINVQELLDAAVGTEHEEETIAFLESQGYEIS